jgi:hypothetical protein
MSQDQLIPLFPDWGLLLLLWGARRNMWSDPVLDLGSATLATTNIDVDQAFTMRDTTSKSDGKMSLRCSSRSLCVLF